MMAPDHVLVFYCRADRIRDPALLDRYRRILSPVEAGKIDRITQAGSRHLGLVARALIRYLAGRYTGCDPASASFSAGKGGKPLLDPAPPAPGSLWFNLSHCRGCVACALCSNREVGVDVETCDRRVNLKVADRFFTPREAELIRQAPQGRKKGIFLDLWTLKEAYVKARGRGLAIPLDSFSFDLSGARIRILFSDGTEPDPPWQFFRWRPEPGKTLAAAVQGPSTIRFSTYHCIPFKEIRPAGPGA